MQADPSVHLGTAPQGEASVLAAIYARAIQRYEETKAAHPGCPDDVTKGFRISEKEKGGRLVEH